MNRGLKAVIFDMDGVLIESEHLWRKAMIAGFAEAEISLTEDDCRQTTGLRIGEVIELWLKRHNPTNTTVAALEKRIVDLLVDLIHTEGKFIAGIPELLSFCKEQNIKTGLATSSSQRLLNTVLKRLNLENYFDAALSAEKLPYGKPHPEVFLNCAQLLGVSPGECVVIEDSVNGVIAGKAARMCVIAVPDPDHVLRKEFVIADYQLDSMEKVLGLFKNLFAKSQPA